MRALLSVLLPLTLAMGCPSLGSLYRDRDNVSVEGDVAYLDDDDPQHRCDLYTPKDGKDDAPVVAFFHGGYWTGQDKQYWEWASGLYGNVGVALAREGFVVANCNYRLFPEVKLGPMLDDVDAAAAFLRDRFDGAPLLLSGHSAGAHLASAAPLLPDGPRTDVDGLILLSGIYDIENAVKKDSEENRDEILIPLFGDEPEEQRQASTRDLLKESAIPVVDVVGDDDFRAVEDDFRVLDDAVFADSAVFVEVAGSDHAGIVLQIGSENDGVTPPVVDFLREHF